MTEFSRPQSSGGVKVKEHKMLILAQSSAMDSILADINVDDSSSKPSKKSKKSAVPAIDTAMSDILPTSNDNAIGEDKKEKKLSKEEKKLMKEEKKRKRKSTGDADVSMADADDSVAGKAEEDGEDESEKKKRKKEKKEKKEKRKSKA